MMQVINGKQATAYAEKLIEGGFDNIKFGRMNCPDDAGEYEKHLYEQGIYSVYIGERFVLMANHGIGSTLCGTQKYKYSGVIEILNAKKDDVLKNAKTYVENNCKFLKNGYKEVYLNGYRDIIECLVD